MINFKLMDCVYFHIVIINTTHSDGELFIYITIIINKIMQVIVKDELLELFYIQ